VGLHPDMRVFFELGFKGQGKGHYTSVNKAVERCRTGQQDRKQGSPIVDVGRRARLNIYPTNDRRVGRYSDRRGPELAERHCVRHGP